MAFLVGLIIIIMAAAGIYLAYQRLLRRAKAVERGLKMVPLLIHLPPPSSDIEYTNRDAREVMKERVTQAQVLYDLLAGTAQIGFKSKFYGQRHIALEIVAHNGIINFYAAVPVAMVAVVSNAILTAYPGARIEEKEDYNIFNPTSKLAGAAGGELILRANAAYPIATPDKLERDPMEAIMNAMSDLGTGDGAGIQIMLRPAGNRWVKRAKNFVSRKKGKGSQVSMQITARDVLKAAVRKEMDVNKEARVTNLTTLEQANLDAIENKTTRPGFEVLVRLMVSSDRPETAQNTLRNLATAFSLYDAPGLNGFKFLPAADISGLATAYIMRYFPPELKRNILNSAELAMLFHVPDAQFTANSDVQRQLSKQVDGPVNLPQQGLLLGYNFFRDTKKEVRLSLDDRRRHSYIIGQTGTGKSTLIENLAVQDMLGGNGFAFIDPHGDTAEKLLSLVPKNRAEDVIYFNPADMDYPLGLNLFEFSDPAQKDFLIQETIGMLYKLYDPGKTGIIGPRYEHWFRNAALTLMADPEGATFIEIPKVFTDAEFLKSKFRHLKDPAVIDFWVKEMGQTSDYHKSEMLGWFVSKFGAFMNNEMMRNILGQTASAFNLREIMDKKKILIVNLSKGRIGELNSQLLGMIFVIKFQAAAMSRAAVPEDQRSDFSLYVDEFQNFSTDSFATILSEARKYHLNLIVANQFIGQLSDQIKDAVFGNVGTIVSYRVGPEDAEFLVKQFAPAFDERDLVNIPNFNAVLRLMIAGLPSQPFSMTALPPLGHANPELGTAIRQLSAAKYGIRRSTVEAKIFARMTARPSVLNRQAAPGMPLATAPMPMPQPAVSAPAPAPRPPAQPVVAAPIVPQPAVVIPPAPAPIPPVPTAQLVTPPVSPVLVTPAPAPPLAKPDPIPSQQALDPNTVRAVAAAQQAAGVPPLKALERSLHVTPATAERLQRQAPVMPVAPMNPATASLQPAPASDNNTIRANIGRVFLPTVQPQTRTPIVPVPEPVVTDLPPSPAPPESAAIENKPTPVVSKVVLAGQHQPEPTNKPDVDTTPKLMDTPKPLVPDEVMQKIARETAPLVANLSGEISVDENGNVIQI